jgi:transcriptional regulator with XRE-family HTH domain
MKTFDPQRVKKRRNRLKLTQAELATRAGTAREYLVEIEKGRKVPKATTLAKIADALNVGVGYFFVERVS